jgi:FtsP/CotA-like multicopper oxidase with cupredoxin domain
LRPVKLWLVTVGAYFTGIAHNIEAQQSEFPEKWAICRERTMKSRWGIPETLRVANVAEVVHWHGHQIPSAVYRSATLNSKMLAADDPLRVRPGRRVLFRFLNASANDEIRLPPPGHKFGVIARDVIWISESELTPSSR